ncbi:MAG: caspase family protein [Hyphomicrobiales bacterium]|nr:caspase family protein [Hyphomicrobiales bacterium]
MLQRLLGTILGLILAVASLNSAALANKRVAMVIGNSGYDSVADLPNPVNDAADVTAALQRLGFVVTTAFDMTSQQMRNALRDFGHKANGADMAVVFFAGHGLEISKQNYLIPVDAKLRTDLDVYYEAIPLDLVMASVSGSKGLRLVLLDACRNNPFATTMKSTSPGRAVGRGFSRIEPTRGTLVGYSAKEGTVADDGIGRNSPYTKALLDHLEQPGLDVQFLFRKVRDKVIEATNGRQEPFTYGSLPGKRIYLKAPEAKPEVVQPKVDDTTVDVAYWNSIKDSNDPAVIRSYIEKFPKGQFTFLARTLLGRVEAQSTGKEAKRKAEAEALARRETELADWQAVRTSTEPAAFQAYLIKYPNGTFADLASAKLEAAKRQQMVALQPQAQTELEAGQSNEPKPIDALNQKDLKRKIQLQLARLGCNPGRPDGVWGRNSRRALQDFARHSNTRLGSLDPTQQLHDELTNRKSRICPLSCGPRQVAKGGSCVLKSCNTGEILTPRGKCVTKVKQHAPRKITTNSNPGKPKSVPSKKTREKPRSKSKKAKDNAWGGCTTRTGTGDCLW